MCTVSYLPVEQGYILTSNRDEDPHRQTAPPDTYLLSGGKKITFPRDMEKGGTWIAMDDLGQVACLLNGAFVRHIRKDQYRMSRGQLILNAFAASGFEIFISEINLEDIEPFTMILVKPDGLYKMVWDGREKYEWKLDHHKPQLWSSATLYSAAEHSIKEQFLEDSLQRLKVIDRESILDIHGWNTTSPFILDKKEVKTVSITQVFFDGNQSRMIYLPR